MITVGQSDNQDGTSGSSDSDTSNTSVKGPKVWEPITQQMFVKESWEDDGILEGEEERSKERVETEQKEDVSSSGSDSESGDTLVHTESMLDKNDNEYKTTTTDSKESAVAVMEKKKAVTMTGRDS